MDTASTSQAAGPSIDSTHGFVNVITLPPQSSSWQNSSGLSFLVFMGIGFGCTLFLILIFAAAYYYWRRRYAWQQDPALPVTAIDTPKSKPDSRPVVLVMQPGGSADVARKEDACIELSCEAKAEPSSPVSPMIPAFRQEINTFDTVIGNGQERHPVLRAGQAQETGCQTDEEISGASLLARNSSGFETKALLDNGHMKS